GDLDLCRPGDGSGLLGAPPRLARPLRRRRRRAVARAGTGAAGDGSGPDPGQPGPPADSWDGSRRPLLAAPRARPAAGPAVPAADPGPPLALRRGGRLVRLPRRRAAPPGVFAGVSVRATAVLDRGGPCGPAGNGGPRGLPAGRS